MATRTWLEILIADDDEQVLASISRVLKAQGHRTRTARHGIEALAQLDEHEIDVLVCDIHMPFKDGIETTKRALERDPTLRVITMTGDPNGELWLRTTRLLGAEATLNKPFTGDELLQILAKH